MKAFISYSHADQDHLTNLEKHLAQVKREGILDSWSDHDIKAGGNLNSEILDELNNSGLFIALVSPDYISSNYCYEKEFLYAQKLHEQGKIIIVPVIVEPCDWHSTPFGDIKAIPKDGKPISTWNNLNTAFLDVITNLRILLNKEENEFLVPKGNSNAAKKYRAQRDFDSIEKMDFVANGFKEITTTLKKFIDEVIEVEGIKAKLFNVPDLQFSCLLVNRNKQNMESTLRITISNVENSLRQQQVYQNSEYYIQAEISSKNSQSQRYTFSVENDDYELFWVLSENHTFQDKQNQIIIQNIIDLIWNQWLHSIGINF